MRLEGPYGGGNQDWYKFEVAVMIGAGILSVKTKI